MVQLERPIAIFDDGVATYEEIIDLVREKAWFCQVWPRANTLKGVSDDKTSIN